MSTQPAQLSLSPTLYRQFTRLKSSGHFSSDADLLRACFEALERQWGQQIHIQPSYRPYMSHPGLSIEDYDT